MSAPSPTIPVLEMIDVAVPSMHRPDLIVVEHVHWSVGRGEFWVISGLPASGKSDLLSVAAGLMRPQAGVVRVFGQDLVHLPEDERLTNQLRLGIVFGNGGRLFSQMTVAENLSLPLCYHHNCGTETALERVQSVLATLELTEISDQTPVLINRNLRQRVALARALVLSPELLFLDNPLAGLDPRESRWWIDFLEKLVQRPSILQGKQLTLVVGTDDLEPWAAEGCQFAYLSDHRFVPVGARANLDQPDNPALRELLPVAWLRE